MAIRLKPYANLKRHLLTGRKRGFTGKDNTCNSPFLTLFWRGLRRYRGVVGRAFVSFRTGTHSEMRNIVPFIFYMLLLVLLVRCAPEKRLKEMPTGCYPYNAGVEVNDRQMIITWRNNCRRLMSGYFIYINEEPLADQYSDTQLPASVKPFNHTPFPGDTNPEDETEHFVAEGLENGVKYYVSVRVVNPDRTLSKPSNEVVAVCGPRGEIELSIRYKSDRDGFSFEKNAYVRTDDIDNDLYFYSKDGTDYLASPSRLNGFLKTNKLKVLPFNGEFDQVRARFSALESQPDQDRVVVKRGDWVHILSSDGKSALVKVLSISGEDEHRRLKLFYAFSPLANEAIF